MPKCATDSPPCSHPSSARRLTWRRCRWTRWHSPRSSFGSSLGWRSRSPCAGGRRIPARSPVGRWSSPWSRLRVHSSFASALTREGSLSCAARASYSTRPPVPPPPPPRPPPVRSESSARARVRGYGSPSTARAPAGFPSRRCCRSTGAAPADRAGTVIRAGGGAVQEVRDVARRRGTTITVSRLFYNAPARQKFLRGTRSEWRGVLEAATTVALVRRDVRLTLTHDGKAALSLPAAASLRDRCAALWGADAADRLLDVEDVRGSIQVSGLAERPADVGTASR